ncbi:unnamed protein product [Haemonchus placei]|uniref:CRAL_TRIO_N domain-containing protein n=1 Tax=Haemonchus placei TaxID=6290 RepID=A0A0N4XBS9_HAEPC|nr:unnamed protein product [Haemonchus placei]
MGSGTSSSPLVPPKKARFYLKSTFQMPPNAPAELDANVVAQVRSQVADLLHPRYDTHFNILRWLQSCEFNIPKTVHNLRKHLKWRKERHLDEDARGLQSCPITAEYAPVSIIGPNRKNGDRLIVVDQSGEAF